MLKLGILKGRGPGREREKGGGKETRNVDWVRKKYGRGERKGEGEKGAKQMKQFTRI